MGKNRPKKPVGKRIRIGARYVRRGARVVLRGKKVELAEVAFKAFELAFERLERDPEAVNLFCKRKVPRLEKKLLAVREKVAGLEAEARKQREAGNHQKTRRLWRRIHVLGLKRRLITMELGLLKELR
jgi:hypothetical protein